MFLSCLLTNTTLFSMVTRWSRSTSHSYLSSGCSKFDRWVCGKFMQHLETCLLIAEANRVLCRLILLCFNRLFAVDVQNEIHLLSRIFNYNDWRVNWVFGWEMRRSTEECSEIIVSKKKLVFVLHLAGCVRGFQSRGRGDTTCRTEKRCSHNLQSGHPAWWSADNCSIVPP